MVDHAPSQRSSSITKYVEGTSSSSTQQLAEIVVTAAKSSRKMNTQASDIAQLRLSNMKLHGRDDDIKLLRSKLRELDKKNDDKEEQKNNGRHDDESNHNKQSTNNNLILVSGISGTGKSAFIHKGLGDDAAKSGYTFASGKFDEKSVKPLSAFSDAMANLAKCIMTENIEMGGLFSSGGLSIVRLIQEKIWDEFDEEDVEQLQRVLPEYGELLGLGEVAIARRQSLIAIGRRQSLMADAGALLRSASGARRSSLVLPAGKESISQMHYAIRRLLKIICSNLKGVILFIDNLHWSDTATLDLLKSIVLDGEIPSLLIVGGYRKDEVPE